MLVKDLEIAYKRDEKVLRFSYHKNLISIQWLTTKRKEVINQKRRKQKLNLIY